MLPRLSASFSVTLLLLVALLAPGLAHAQIELEIGPLGSEIVLSDAELAVLCDEVEYGVDGSIVFRLNEDHSVERLVVKIGIHRDGQIELLDGIAPGDVVIVRGHTVLANGSRVSVRNEDGTPRLPTVASGASGQEGSE